MSTTFEPAQTKMEGSGWYKSNDAQETEGLRGGPMCEREDENAGRQVPVKLDCATKVQVCKDLR